LTNFAIDTAENGGDIYARGYGIVPKSIAKDWRLSLTAKAIYAYFCVYSDENNTAFPSRDRILKDLNINKQTYYNHLRQLTESGLIVVSGSHNGGQFGNNRYFIPDMPKKGIPTNGKYGKVAKAVLTDRELSAKAKGLYTYYSVSICETGGAMPCKEQVMRELGIGCTAFEHLNKELEQNGYIAVYKRIVNGRFSSNLVTLSDGEAVEEVSRDIVKQTIVAAEQSEREEHRAVSVLENQYTSGTDKPECDKPDRDTKSTPNQKYPYFKNTTFSQKQKDRIAKYHRIKENAAFALGRGENIKHFDDDEVVLQDLVLNEILETGTVPKKWLDNRDIIRATVEVLVDDELCGNREAYQIFDNGDYEWGVFCLYRDALIDMLSSKTPMTLNGETVTAEDVYYKLIDFVEINRRFATAGITELLDNVRYQYANAVEKFKITKPSAYIKTCVWKALQQKPVTSEFLA